MNISNGLKQNNEKILEDIKSIKIQGATNIAKASIGALFNFSENFVGKNPDIFIKKAEQLAEKFSWARPDEPLNQNLLALIIEKGKKDKSKNIKEKIANFQMYCTEASDLILRNEELVTANGVELIRKIYNKKNPLLSLRGADRRLFGKAQNKLRNSVNIFTHCNSSSVFKAILGAYQAGMPVKVYDSETRPRFQGRIMAKKLVKNGINVTMMTDSAAPFVISKNDPDGIDIDIVIVGADVLSEDGAILNKIGSYSLALAAKNAGVPFYAATSLLKLRRDFNSYREIKIEKRDPTELWSKSLKGIKTINYAFDTVPPKYISGLITEFGILKPKDVEKTAVKKYKKIFNK